MGAVGLNFGSATSGQGFDVTSTVNQIVTNLQAVETPWKTQLTALTSKDTALTSLGTQLSTLIDRPAEPDRLQRHDGLQDRIQFRYQRADACLRPVRSRLPGPTPSPFRIWRRHRAPRRTP